MTEKGKFESITLKAVADGQRNFVELVRIEVARVVTMVGKSLDKCVRSGSLKEEIAVKLMKDWILTVNARLSVSGNKPEAIGYADLIDSIVVKPEDGKSFLALKSEWETFDEAKRKTIMDGVKAKNNAAIEGFTKVAQAVDVTKLTIGQLEACIEGKLMLCLNAGKHLLKGKLKESREGGDYVRKFSVVPHTKAEEAISLITQKTYTRWLNSIISDQGQLINRYQDELGSRRQWKRWTKPVKGKKGKEVPIYEEILIELINNTRTFKPGSSGVIKVGVFSATAAHITFGCYQVGVASCVKTGSMFALKPENKDAYVQANVIVPLEALTPK